MLGRALLSVLLILVTAGCGSTPTTPAPAAGGGAGVLPLALTCPASLSATTLASTLTVAYAAPSTTGGTLPVTTSCTPASGTAFARGTTPVACQAADSAGQTASCAFSVTVSAAPQLSGTRFMAFGDSFTAGEILSASRVKVVSVAKSYPTQLYNLLVARYTNQAITVSNRGESGEQLTFLGEGGPERSEETRLRYGSALTVEKPDAVLLLEGVNDFNVAGISDDDIVGVLQRMVREARAAGAKAVFVATLPPQIPGLLRSGKAARVPTFNAKLKVMIAAEGATLVDVYAAMLPNVTTLINSEDGLHPLPAGYVVMAETFFAAIRETLETTGVTTARR